MMKIQLFSLIAFTLCSCASYHTSTQIQSNLQNLRSIDEFLVQEFNHYSDQCYINIRKGNPPNNRCESKLYEVAERRSGTKFKAPQLNVAADEIFYNEFKDKLKKKLSQDENLKKEMRNKFKSVDDLITSYRKKYSFTEFD